MLVNRTVLAAKIETVYNVGVVPAVTDAILVENLSWSYANARMIERKPVRQSLAALQQVFAGTLLEISGDVEIKGPGAAYSASVRPELDVILRICGMGVTVNVTLGAETCIYSLVSTGHESGTIYLYLDGLRLILTGCRGSIDGNLKTGETGKFSFKILGHVGAATDTPIITPTYDTTTPPPVIGANFTIGAYAACIDALQFGPNWTVATPSCMNSADGYGEVILSARDSGGTFDPEAVLVATNDFHGQWRSGAVMAMTTGFIGGVQYNKYKVDQPAVSLRSIAPGDRDGKVVYALAYGAAETATDNEFAITFA